jgi:hypothetical protein
MLETYISSRREYVITEYTEVKQRITYSIGVNHGDISNREYLCCTQNMTGVRHMVLR